MMNKHSILLKAIALLLSCSTMPVLADDCSSAAVSGVHRGSFSAKGTRIQPGSVKNITGSWTIKIDPKTCAIDGSVTSELFGTVKVAGRYGVYAPVTATFDAKNIFLQETGDKMEFQNFSFSGSEDQLATFYKQDYTYMGRYTVDH
jgi:hypothetical protein